MNNKEYIDKIYQNTIDKFLENIPAEKKEELKKLYYNYLIRAYSNKELNDNMAEYYQDIEVLGWENFSLEGKLSVVLEDKNLEELKKLSLEGMRYATSYVKDGTKIDVALANEKTKLMEELFNKVLDVNKVLAQNYYSEGVLDFEFATGTTNISSLRTGRIR